MIISNKHNGGFTLLETLVAIAILLIAVVGPISLIGNSLQQIYYARDQMAAINLAQEGLDVVRQMRDSNKLAGGSWTTGFTTDGDYVVDPYLLISGGVPLIICNSCSQLVVFDTTNEVYRQSFAGNATPFSRVVNVSSTGLNSEERKVTSTVTWKTGNQTGTLVVSGYLFNWQP